MRKIVTTLLNICLKNKAEKIVYNLRFAYYFAWCMTKYFGGMTIPVSYEKRSLTVPGINCSPISFLTFFCCLHVAVGLEDKKS